MKETAARHAFEQAAAYRDIWQQLSLLCDQLGLLQSVQREYWFVYPLNTDSRKTLWMLVAGGQVVSVLPEPRTPNVARRCLTLLRDHLLDRRQAETVDYEQLRLVAAWFRQHPGQWEHVLQPQQAIDFCRELCTAACFGE